MDLSLLDALLGFALAYSATYVLYCWMHSDKPAQTRDTTYPDVNLTAPDLAPRRNTTSPSGITLARFTARPPLSEK